MPGQIDALKREVEKLKREAREQITESQLKERKQSNYWSASQVQEAQEDALKTERTEHERQMQAKASDLQQLSERLETEKTEHEQQMRSKDGELTQIQSKVAQLSETVQTKDTAYGELDFRFNEKVFEYT